MKWRLFVGNKGIWLYAGFLVCSYMLEVEFLYPDILDEYEKLESTGNYEFSYSEVEEARLKWRWTAILSAVISGYVPLYFLAKGRIIFTDRVTQWFKFKKTDKPWE